MSKTILYIAISLDGKIARKDNSLDWLYAIENPNNLDHGYGDLLNAIGTTIMGKNTYNEIIGFGVDWPYADKQSYVVTSDANFQVSSPNTEVISGDLTDFISNLKATSEKDIWVIGGGQLIASLLEKQLIDQMIITLVPITLGEGIPLFTEIAKENHWVLSHVEKFETGLVNLTYDKK